MSMEVVVKVTDHTTCMVLIHVVLVTGVVVNHQVTSKTTTLTDINHTVLGVQVVMDASSMVEVLEDVKVSS